MAIRYSHYNTIQEKKMKRKDDRFASRVKGLVPEGAYEVLAKAQQLEATGREIIHLEIGQPDFETYANIKLAGIRAITTGFTRYTPSTGIIDLQKEIAAYTSERVGITFHPRQVVVGPGAKPLLFFPMMALLDEGDEVIYPDPGFPSYLAIIEAMQAVPVPVPLNEAGGFSFDMQRFRERVSKRTRMVIINSPSNPTGGIVGIKDLKAIAAAAQKYDFWVLSDEIYSRLTYEEDTAPSIISLPEMEKRTILVDGFSKTYAMTGWRLGYGIMPEDLAHKVGLLLTHSLGCTAGFTQIAGIEALSGPQEQVEQVRSVFKKRRDIIVKGLNDIPGIDCQKPSGAFYVFPNIKSLGRSSEEIAEYLLIEAGVAVLPGTSFGSRGEGYLRLCYANSAKKITEALERMKKALGNL
jgi:aspartate/methionine/tyrosine aminotransferase